MLSVRTGGSIPVALLYLIRPSGSITLSNINNQKWATLVKPAFSWQRSTALAAGHCTDYWSVTKLTCRRACCRRKPYCGYIRPWAGPTGQQIKTGRGSRSLVSHFVPKCLNFVLICSKIYMINSIINANFARWKVSVRFFRSEMSLFFNPVRWLPEEIIQESTRSSRLSYEKVTSPVNG